MAPLGGLASALVAAVSAYALYHSAQSMPKLRKYEEKAEKAAEWSSMAERRLKDTRYMVATGFVTTLVSLATALYILLLASSGGFSLLSAAWAGALAFGEFSTARYMHSFWADKKMIPMMEDYNEAIKDTINVIGLSKLLAVGWAAIAVLRLLGI